MLVNFKQDNKIEIPKHDINEEVLFFDHVNGTFDYGTVSQLQVVKTEQYQTIAYAITLSNGNTLPCVPESLVFNDKNDAELWIDTISRELKML